MCKEGLRMDALCFVRKTVVSKAVGFYTKNFAEKLCRFPAENALTFGRNANIIEA